MTARERIGFLARLRRQGAAALILALTFVFGVAAQSYARGLSGPDEEMCRSAVSLSQTQASDGATAPSRHDGSCCDVCVCAFPMGLAAPSGAPILAPRTARRLPRNLRESRLAPSRRLRRPRLRDPPEH